MNPGNVVIERVVVDSIELGMLIYVFYGVASILLFASSQLKCYDWKLFVAAGIVKLKKNELIYYKFESTLFQKQGK